MRSRRKVALFGLITALGWTLGVQTLAVPAWTPHGIFTISPSAGGLMVRFPVGLAEMTTERDLGAIGLNWSNPETGRSESMAGLLDLRTGDLRWSRRYANSNCCGDPLIHLSPDGSRLLAAGDEVVLWNSAGKVLSRTPLPEGKISIAAAISADGRRGVVVASNGLLLTLDMRTGAGVWAKERVEAPTSLAVSASGDVVALGTLRGIFLDWAGRRELLWPGSWRWAAVALSEDGGRLAAAWKLLDGTVVAGAFSSSKGIQPLWTRTLWEGTVPVVKSDAQGQTILVGDFLGRGAALLSREGRILWRSSQREGVHADLSQDGRRLVLASGSILQVRRLPDMAVEWQSVLPGVALKVRMAWPWVIVIGSGEHGSMVPDRIWLLRSGQADYQRRDRS